MTDRTIPDQLKGLNDLSEGALHALEHVRRAYANTVDMAKTADLPDAAKCYIVIRDTNEALGDMITELNKLRQVIQTKIVPEKFQAQNVTSFTVDNRRVTVSALLSVTMKDKIGGKDWLRENGLGDIIQETVNAQTLSAAIRKKIEDENLEPPDDMFTLTPVLNTSVTTVKNKAGK